MLEQALRSAVRSAKYVLRPEYRAAERIRKLPRYTPFTTELLGPPVRCVDGASFIASYNEIFKRGIYRFETPIESPLIIDCGANIGLSVIYFKRLFPTARITAFEADPAVFEVLSWNIRSLGIDGVQLHNKAVWNEETTLDFFSEGADAGRVTAAESNQTKTRRVEAVRLKDFLRHDSRIALLKMDIEGAETTVLRDCASQLLNVDKVFVEYHSFENQRQELHELLSILDCAGFRVYASPVAYAEQPFVKREVYLGMDMQMNIFATRE